MLLDTGTNKSFMSKTSHLNCPSLHSLPRFVLRTKNILVGNAEYIGVLFVILVIIDLNGYRFELHTLVSEIHGCSTMIEQKLAHLPNTQFWHTDSA